MAWRKYLPTTGEKGDHTGLLSTRGEWHALIIGFGVWLIDPRLIVGVIGLALTGREGELRGHAKDAARELAYMVGGVLFAMGVQYVGM